MVQCTRREMAVIHGFPGGRTSMENSRTASRVVTCTSSVFFGILVTWTAGREAGKGQLRPTRETECFLNGQILTASIADGPQITPQHAKIAETATTARSRSGKDHRRVRRERPRPVGWLLISRYVTIKWPPGAGVNSDP